jgi:hypothetical protein
MGFLSWAVVCKDKKVYGKSHFYTFLKFKYHSSLILICIVQTLDYTETAF